MLGTFGVKILPHFVLKSTICGCRYPTSASFFFVGLWDAGWGWCEKNLTYCVWEYKKFHNRVAYKMQQSKTHTHNEEVWHDAAPHLQIKNPLHSCRSLMEQPTPLVATTAADVLLGLRHLAWLASLG
jgi:hypothetical protein